jgi:hypothetical protein
MVKWIDRASVLSGVTMSRAEAITEAHRDEAGGRENIVRVIDECIRVRDALGSRRILEAALRAHGEPLPTAGWELYSFLGGALRTALERALGVEAGSDTLSEIEVILAGVLRANATAPVPASRHDRRTEPAQSGERDLREPTPIGQRPTLPPQAAHDARTLVPPPERRSDAPRDARVRAERMAERRIVSFEAAREKRFVRR